MELVIEELGEALLIVLLGVPIVAFVWQIVEVASSF